MSKFRSRWFVAVMVLSLLAALGWGIAAVRAAGLSVGDTLARPRDAALLAFGVNPHPVRLVLPASAPLSAVGQLGRALFFDARLSGSGRQSCASCHDPAHAFAPAGDRPVQLGGRGMDRAGARAVPSLEYLYRQQVFSIGPDVGEQEGVNLAQEARAGGQAPRPTKLAAAVPAPPASVPQGGLFWDGRADTLQQQAAGPLFNPLEMDAGSVDEVAAKLERDGYGATLRQLFGPAVFADPRRAVAEALFALARFQIESPAFHPFSSKYDAWLQGRARLSPQEVRGYLAFTDPRRGNCAACHTAQPTRDGLPPLFTDTQYEALGVPRNPAIPLNRDPAYRDQGLCGPYRTDLRDQTVYCGMFLTPTLRNAATRHAFFHNGVYRRLDQVLAFYNDRELHPDRVYPRAADGRVRLFDDLPPAARANVDRTDPPFDRRAGAASAPMSAQDMRDIVAFIRTLDDGWTR